MSQVFLRKEERIISDRVQADFKRSSLQLMSMNDSSPSKKKEAGSTGTMTLTFKGSAKMLAFSQRSGSEIRQDGVVKAQADLAN